jgi:hypothetical protein
MSDGFPSGSCVDVILSHGEVVEAGGRFPASPLVSGKGRKTGGVRTRLPRELKVLWTMMRVAQLIVVPGSEGGRSGCSRWR